MEETEIDGIECICLGSVIHTDDNEKKKFYLAYQVEDLTVKIGDCVRVTIEGDDYDQGYAQVLAIYEDERNEVFAEVRWFLLPHEIPAHQQKQ